MKLRIVPFLFLLMCNLQLIAQNDQDVLDYIEKYKTLAIEEQVRIGVPASITLAQGIHESTAGKSELAVNGNNHFGIKCGDRWTGGTYYLKDDDYDKHGNHIQSCFRAYSDPMESFMAHSNFITGEGRMTNRYASLFLLPSDDYKGWAEGLQKAGYATHPLYAKRLISIIQDYRLYVYDKNASQPTPDAPPGFFMDKEKSPFTKVNGLKSVFVDHQASPAEIAMDFNLPVELVMKYNEILTDENAAIGTPMYVFLEKKKKKSSTQKEYHLVSKGETIESISQLYGIQAKYLYRRNRIKSGSQPSVGSKIYLSRRSKYAPNLQMASTNQPQMMATTSPEQNLPVVPKENNENKIIQTVRTPLEQTLTSTNENDAYYTVQEKDTLFSIAKKFNTTVATLKSLNQLELDTIKIGQQLKTK